MRSDLNVDSPVISISCTTDACGKNVLEIKLLDPNMMHLICYL